MKQSNQPILICIIFFISVFTTNSQNCKYPCNGKITANPWTAGSQQLNPFSNDTVECWTSAGWHPQICDTAWSAPTSVRLWSLHTTSGTSIKTNTKYSFIKGQKYIASMMLRCWGQISVDSVVLSISPKIPVSINIAHPIPAWKQTVLTALNVSDTNWYQVTACFIADSTNAMELWLCAYDHMVVSPGYTGPKPEVLIDDIEVIPDYGFAGPNKISCNYTDVVLGNNCTFLNFTVNYDWWIIGGLTATNRDPINTPNYTTNYAACYYHTRYLINLAGDTVPCQNGDTVCVTTGIVPNFSLGSDTTICQSESIWLFPQNLSPSGRVYKYHWHNPSRNNDSMLTGMQVIYTLTITDSISGCSKTVSRRVYRDPDIIPWSQKYLYCKSSLPFNVCTDTGHAEYWTSINFGSFTGPYTSPCVTLDTSMIYNGHIWVVFKIKADSIPNCYGYDTFDVEIKEGKFYLPSDTEFCGYSYRIRLTDPIDSLIWYRLGDSNVMFTGSEVTFDTSGNYVVNGYDPEGCLLINDTIHIVIHTPPKITLATYPVSTVCQTGLIAIDSIATPYNGYWKGQGVVNISGNYFFNIDSGVCGDNIINYIITDTNGCNDSAIAIIPKYCGKHIDSVPPQCVTNDSILLTATPPYGAFYGAGITYSQGIGYYFHPQFFNTLISPTLTKVYLNYTDSAGCQGTDSIFIQINVGPYIESIYNSNGNFHCGDTITPDRHCLKDGILLIPQFDTVLNVGHRELWSNGDTSFNTIIYGKGIYWVKITLPTGCYSIDTIIITDDPCYCCLGDSLLQTFQKEQFILDNNLYPVSIRYTPWDSGYISLSGMSRHDSAQSLFCNSQYIVLTKYNKSGNVSWNKKFTFDNNVYPSDLELDGDTYVILGDKLFMHDSPGNEVFDDSSDYQVMIMTVDVIGNFLGVNYYGGKFEDHGHDLLVTRDDYVVVGSGWRIYDSLRYNPVFMNALYLPDTIWNGINHCEYFHPADQSLYFLRVEKGTLTAAVEKLYSFYQDTCALSGNPLDTQLMSIRTHSYENGVRVVSSLNAGNYTILGNMTLGRLTTCHSDSNPVVETYTSDIIMLEVDKNGLLLNQNRFGYRYPSGLIQGHIDLANDMIVTDNEYYILGGTNSDPAAGNTVPKQDTVYWTLLGKVNANLDYVWMNGLKSAGKVYRMNDSLFTIGLNLVEHDSILYIYGNTFRKNEASVPYLMILDKEGNSVSGYDSLQIFFHGSHAGPSGNYTPHSFIGSGLIMGEPGSLVIQGVNDRNFYGHLGSFMIKIPITGQGLCGINYGYKQEFIENQFKLEFEQLNPCDFNSDFSEPEISTFTPHVLCCQNLEDSIFHQENSYWTLNGKKGKYLGAEFYSKRSINNNQKKEIQIFPNPTTGLITIEVSKLGRENFQIELYSADGRKCPLNIQYSNQYNPLILSVSNLSSGIYYIKIIAESNTYYKAISLIK